MRIHERSSHCLRGVECIWWFLLHCDYYDMGMPSILWPYGSLLSNCLDSKIGCRWSHIIELPNIFHYPPPFPPPKKVPGIPAEICKFMFQFVYLRLNYQRNFWSCWSKQICTCSEMRLWGYHLCCYGPWLRLHATVSGSGSIQWTELVRPIKESWIICLDALSRDLQELPPRVEDGLLLEMVKFAWKWSKLYPLFILKRPLQYFA